MSVLPSITIHSVCMCTHRSFHFIYFSGLLLLRENGCHQFGGTLEHASKARPVESVINTCFTSTWEVERICKLVPFFCDRKMHEEL